MQLYYPEAGFYFRVGMSASKSDMDAQFQEVSGIGVETDVMEYQEGGINDYSWKLPKAPRHDKLVLRKGLLSKKSDFRTWCKNNLVNNNMSNAIEPQQLWVTLLNPTGQPAMQWMFYNAYPVKWSLSSFDSMKNDILVESIELVYTYFTETIY
ncbi:MAG: phage tail protein [Chitinophagaceae bacterium]